MEQKKLLIFDFDGVIVDSMQLAFKNVASVHPSLTWEIYRNVSHKKTLAEADKEYKHLRIDETKEEKEERAKKYSKKSFSISCATSFNPDCRPQSQKIHHFNLLNQN